jgi:acetyltransferase-like isoleucine patch superfamily enzyme
MLNPGYLSEGQLSEIGLKRLGSNVLIAHDAIFIGVENIEIGSNVRIDSNVTLAAVKGFIKIGNYVHIGGSSHINCTGGVSIGNFVAVSQGVKIYSASDDYSGEYMTNPTVPGHLRRDQIGEINIGDHVILGSGSVILPGVALAKGTAVGALSLIKSSTDEFSIYAGSPAKKIGARARKVEELAAELIEMS